MVLPSRGARTAVRSLLAGGTCGARPGSGGPRVPNVAGVPAIEGEGGLGRAGVAPPQPGAPSAAPCALRWVARFLTFGITRGWHLASEMRIDFAWMLFQ